MASARSGLTNAYITGQAASSDLPVTIGVIQSTLNEYNHERVRRGFASGSNDLRLPTSLNFGTQLVGATTAPMFVTLTNNTASAITLTIPATISRTNPADFAESAGTCTASLPAAGTCTIGATFTPAAAQAVFRHAENRLHLQRHHRHQSSDPAHWNGQHDHR